MMTNWGAISGVQVSFHLKFKEFHLRHTRSIASDDCALELWSLDYKKPCFEDSTISSGSNWNQTLDLQFFKYGQKTRNCRGAVPVLVVKEDSQTLYCTSRGSRQ